MFCCVLISGRRSWSLGPYTALRYIGFERIFLDGNSMWISNTLTEKLTLYRKGLAAMIVREKQLLQENHHNRRWHLNLFPVQILVKSFIIVVTLFAVVGALKSDVNICENVKDSIFLPYLGNCSRYYVCMKNVAIERECEVGYLFDSKNQTCTYPHEARCAANCTDALSSFCYDRTCTKYVLCYAGKPIVRECCDGLQYNAETDRCDFPQFVDCVDNLCTIFNNPENITYLSSKASCDKFYVCMDGIAFNQTCAKGLQFNPKCNCCDFPSNTNCTVTSLQRNIPSLAKAPPRRATIKCPEEGSHFFPHARSDRYNFCMNGKGIVLDCTPGLVYDKIRETCREPQYVEEEN